VSNDPPVFPGRIDPSDRFRERRRRSRRRRRIRRLVIVAVLCGAITALALNARFISDGDRAAESAPTAVTTAAAGRTAESAAPVRPRALPREIRGVHVTMALASIPGKIDEYLALDGLNTIELDVKDENGDVAFRAGVPLARQVGAAESYYNPSAIANRIHRAGLYLIGRVVVFEDPKLAEGRPELAIRRGDGSVWRNAAGLGWTNPYDRRVWEYNVDIAEAAARAGFDEIMFDYVRFPSDGDVGAAVYRGKRAEPRWKTVTSFVRYASERLRPLGVRVSAAVFGLSATRDLGIGQRPRQLAAYLDTIYPMVYPSHYNPGEYDLSDPSAEPGLVVSRSLLDFRARLEGTDVKLVPWLQDFSLGRTYSVEDVAAQIDAARRAGEIGGRVIGFMLWNAGGVYTSDALAYR
jgi:hypothetical protein